MHQIARDSALAFLLLVSAAHAANDPQWVWSGPNAQDGETILVRKVLERTGSSPVYLSLTCDNEYTLFINGQRIGQSRGDGNWRQMDGYRIDAVLKPGGNVIAIRARNLTDAAGLVVRIHDGTGPDSKTLATSDDSWVWNANYSPGWATQLKVDRYWKPVHVIGPAGQTAPWGNIQRVSQERFVVARPMERRDRKKLSAGDRIVFLGGTLVERAQRFGHLETAITRRLPGQNVTVRNLGWSADTVWCESRGIFDPPAQGYTRMIEQVQGLEPDWVVVNYGQNESFAGPAGLGAFLSQLDQLVNDLRDTGATVVLASPVRQVPMAAPLPPLGDRNSQIDLYSEAIAQFASERSLAFVDWLDVLERAHASAPEALTTGDRVTENGLHLTDAGYWMAADHLASRLLSSLQAPVVPALSEITIDVEEGTIAGTGAEVGNLAAIDERWEWTSVSSALPAADWNGRNRDSVRVAVAGLKPGDYQLVMDGVELTRGTAADWQQGIVCTAIPEREQTRALRDAIVRKNELYFHHWRPQNITYLFLFRKHEQGNNAGEVEEFNVLVGEADRVIERLNQPVKRSFVLSRIEPTKRGGKGK